MVYPFDEQDVIFFKQYLATINSSRLKLTFIFIGIGILNILLALGFERTLYGIMIAIGCFAIAIIMHTSIGHNARKDMKEKQKIILTGEIQNKKTSAGEYNTDYLIKINEEWFLISFEEYTKCQIKDTIQIYQALYSKKVLKINLIKHQ